MLIKKQIPNLITLGNAACGFVAIFLAFHSAFELALYFILIGATLDFFDGFAARLLNVKSEMGAQLDSMSDIVTFGIAPGFCLTSYSYQFFVHGYSSLNEEEIMWVVYVLIIGVLPVLFGAYRLARFNAYPSKSTDFEGLAIPSAGIFLASLPVISINHYLSSIGLVGWIHPDFFLVFSVLISILMVTKWRLFSLKMSSFSFKAHPFQISFLVLSLVMVISFLLINKLLLSVPLIVLLYLILSFIRNLTKKNEIQSTH